MKLIAALFAVVLTLGLMSCTDAEVDQYSALGKQHRVTLYAVDGHVIKQWETTGLVKNETQSDGWYFNDKATNKLVEITGTIVIEQE